MAANYQGMTYDVTLLILLATAFHAGWNALNKIRGELFAVMVIISL